MGDLKPTMPLPEKNCGNEKPELRRSVVPYLIQLRENNTLQYREDLVRCFFMDAKAIPKQRGRVFVYKLGGQASLPPPLDFQKLIPAPPQLVADAEQVARGADVYQYYCWQCHGANAISAGVLPELRASAALHSEEAWYAIVLGGALSAQGMPKFEQWISESDAESLRAYVTSEARRALDSDAQQQTQKH